MLDVVIVNWNSGSFAEECCEAIIASDIDLDLVNVIFVDNGSTDDSLERVKDSQNSSMSINLIELTENQGFARACNIGAQAGEAKYLLFLNPDTKVEKETLRKSLDKIQCQNAPAVLGSRHTDEAGETVPSCSRFPAPGDFFFDAIGLTRLFPQRFKRPTIIGLGGMNYEVSDFVDEVSGAFFLLRRADFEHQNGFDETFFVYYEELDLSLRIKRGGGLIYYDTDLVIQHVGGGVSSKVKDRRLFYELRSRLRYANKHFQLAGICIVWLTTLAIEPFSRAALLLGTRRFGELKALTRAFGMLYFFSFKNFFRVDWRR